MASLNRMKSLALALSAMAAVGSPAWAHHSFGMFDRDHEFKTTGTVTKFDWTNPHVYIELDTPGENGASAKHYTVECSGIGVLVRSGWKFNTVKPGDKITMIIAPLHSGEPGGLLLQLVLTDGTKLGNGGVAGKPNIS